MKKHKYFRSLDYKNKLESEYKKQCGRYKSHIYFLTKDVDPRFIREEWHCVMRYSNIYRAEYFYGRNANGMFKYWHKPEVEYSIGEYIPKKYARRRFFKRYDNRVVRRKINMLDDLLPYRGEYKKLVNGWY